MDSCGGMSRERDLVLGRDVESARTGRRAAAFSARTVAFALSRMGRAAGSVACGMGVVCVRDRTRTVGLPRASNTVEKNPIPLPHHRAQLVEAISNQCLGEV